MKPLLLLGCMAAGLAVCSCDMMLESADYAPGYTVSTGIVPPPAWNPGWNNPGWNIGYAPVIAPSPHPPGYIPPQPWRPSVNPLPVRPAGSAANGRPVTLPANPATPVTPALPTIPANGNRPGAQLTPPANSNNNNVQVTRPVQGRH